MKLLKILLAFLAGLLSLLPVQAQNPGTQNLKGQVIDKAVRFELIGATVQVAPANVPDPKPLGAVTDPEGRFRLPGLPVGKYTVLVSYPGYRNAVINNVTLDAGKETELIIEMDEMVIEQKAVVITARQKEKPLNDLSVVSTRTFSVEETRRFAAAVNDPARMATSFAGVVSANDGNNHIVIRGNAPNGLLWRMEGVDIPNPNHFSSVGTSGGGISILSAQLLSNSDFSTGAFAAEYGNALSGVFDMKLRRGNTDRREFTLSAGLLGLDAAAEGPLGGGGSYLVNYRYSTLSLLAKLGVPIGDAVTNFQDLSFNITRPAGKAGSFSLFGFGGLSRQKFQGKADSIAWDEDIQYKFPHDFVANTGAAGITHNKIWGANTHLKSAIVLSGTENGLDAFQFLPTDYSRRLEYETRSTQSKITFSSVLSRRISSRHYLRAGAYLNQIAFKLRQADYDEESEVLQEQLRRSGNTQTIQAFAQWQYRPTDQLTFLLGAHGMGMLLNNTFSIEPRAALKYAPDNKHTYSIGYGLHSQVLPLGLYFLKDAQGVLLNPDLSFSKAQHFVAAYEYFPQRLLHFKGELYYQQLFDVPVEKDRISSFSLLNELEGTAWKSLGNTGKGRNYGLELTAEQFLHKGFYWLASASLFRSEYQGSDEVWRSTRFDSRYAGSLTAGKEWEMNRRGKNRSFGLNMKLVGTGGQRDTPIDLQASVDKGYTVYVEDKAFTLQLPDYFRLDAGVRFKRNYRNLTTTLSLDIQNVSNRQNLGGRYYNPNAQKVEEWFQAPMIPVLAYRLDF